MEESFILRAKENLTAANLLFDNGLYNASANRAYYSALHAAFSVLSDIEPNMKLDHRIVQKEFSNKFFNRRKIFPSKYKDYLKELQTKRNDADYHQGISKNIARMQLKLANEFVDLVLGNIS